MKFWIIAFLLVWLTPSDADSFECNQLNSQNFNQTLIACMKYKWETTNTQGTLSIKKICCHILDIQCIQIKMSKKCSKPVPQLVLKKDIPECKEKGFIDLTPDSCKPHILHGFVPTPGDCSKFAEYMNCDWTPLPGWNGTDPAPKGPDSAPKGTDSAPKGPDSAPHGTDPNETPLPKDPDTSPHTCGVVDLKSFGSLSLCLAFITIWINV